MMQLFLRINYEKVLVIFFILILSFLPVLKYSSLHTTVMDLGVNTYNLFNISRGEWQRIFFGHVQPFLLLFQFPFSLFGDYGSRIILFIQALGILSPFYFLYFNYAKLTAVAYILFFPVWFNLLFDFHIDHLIIPFTFFFFHALRRGSYSFAFASAVLISLVKEPFALITIACGFYLMFSYRRSEKYYFILSLLLAIYGALYFYISVTYLLPQFTGGVDQTYLASHSYSKLGEDLESILAFIIFHPFDTLKIMFFDNDKFMFVTLLFSGLLFLPMLKIRAMIVALPMFAIILLSNNNMFYSLGHHYTAGMIIPLIIGFHESTQRLLEFKVINNNKRLFLGSIILSLLVTNFILSPSPLGRLFWSNKIWFYSLNAYFISERDEIIKKALETHLPKNPKKSISVQNSINFDLINKRNSFLLFPEGILEPKKVPIFINSTSLIRKDTLADFVVIDIKRPLFIGDKGCNWIYGKCIDKEIERNFIKYQENTRSIMDKVFEYDGFFIFKRP